MQFNVTKKMLKGIGDEDALMEQVGVIEFKVNLWKNRFFKNRYRGKLDIPVGAFERN